jgi:hypothetical protein
MYVTRIAYNSSGWQRPTGEAAATEAKGSYNKQFGFGHEDWLFRTEWTLDGWRYAFLQGVNKSYKRLKKSGAPFDVRLFTVEPGKGTRYVAELRGVEYLDDAEAARALDEFRRRE